MKRMICVLLVLCMVIVSITACGGKEADNTSKATEQTTDKAADKTSDDPGNTDDSPNGARIDRDISTGMYYVLNYDEATRTFSNESFSLRGIGSCTDTVIVIPVGYNGLPVTTIGKGAFQNCEVPFTEIDIPREVVAIYDNAFDGCTSLTDITYNGTKAEWESVEKGENWDRNTPAYTVHCSDGDIAK